MSSVTVAFAFGATASADIVVFASTVAFTASGLSTRIFGTPPSRVTVNAFIAPSAHGIGDCWMFR